jgi:two-component system sensor histidine kinase PilS (NtrC family)
VTSPSRQDISEHLREIRHQQNVSLLRIYNFYRIVLGAALLVIALRESEQRLLGALDSDTFVRLVVAYLLANLVVAIGCLAAPARFIDRQPTGFFIVVADIVALTVLIHLSGGVDSGLAALIIVSVAAGSMLVLGRVATLIPALASIAILYEEFVLQLADGSADFFQAGILGALYFGTSLFIQGVSRRLHRSEATSLARGAEVASLEQMNRVIVQRLRTGILVLDPSGTLRLVNSAGRRLLGLPEDENEPATLPARLQQDLVQWLASSQYRPPLFRPDPTRPEVRVNFSRLDGEGDTDIIVFVEDNAELQQQAQQLKLAALGRLSASIAHEIRNPLGAISHAAQLLRESPSLDKPDLRLTDIIQTHSRRMNEVIENILELSRRRAPEPRRLAMREWLEEFAGRFRETAGRPVEIEIAITPEDTLVRLDPRQLDQVLTNLVANGMRYSEKRVGRPWVRLEGGIETGTERPFLHVIDAGGGVPEAQLEHLFEPFYTTEENGTGLGLYISRELCEANQTQLTYRDRNGEGSCFRLHFPHPERQTVEGP